MTRDRKVKTVREVRDRSILDDFDRNRFYFLDDLEASPFGREVGVPAPPEGSVSLVDSELEPPVVWSFPLQVSLRAEEETP